MYLDGLYYYTLRFALHRTGLRPDDDIMRLQVLRKKAQTCLSDEALAHLRKYLLVPIELPYRVDKTKFMHNH